MPPTGTTTAPNRPAAQAPALLVPFTRGARQHVEPFFDRTDVLTAATVQVPPNDVPAYGFLRHILVLVEGTTAANAAAVTFAADSPFNVFTELALTDVNGQPIVGPFSGYELMLANKFGGYSRRHDPRIVEFFATAGAGATGGSFRFLLRVPVETNEGTGYTSLSNMNSASTYKIRYTLAASATLYGVAPTTPPSVRVRMSQEAWSPPAQANAMGQAQMVNPPGPGSTQNWSMQSYTLAAGTNRVQLARVGNYIRNLILVFRDVANVRQNANIPDPLQLFWDSRQVSNVLLRMQNGYMAERFDLTVPDGTFDAANALDTGTQVLSFTHTDDGMPGYESGNQWIPTIQATRLELLGTFAAGTLQVITNDILPAGAVAA